MHGKRFHFGRGGLEEDTARLVAELCTLAAFPEAAHGAVQHIQRVRYVRLLAGQDYHALMVHGSIDALIGGRIAVSARVKPLVDSMLLVRCGQVIFGCPGGALELAGLEISIDQQRAVCRGVGAAVQGKAAQMLARVKLERGPESAQASSDFGFFHSLQQVLAHCARTQFVAIHMQHPGGSCRHVGALKRQGR